MKNFIPIQIKKACCDMLASGASYREIYDNYFKPLFDNPQTYQSFKVSISRWCNNKYVNDLTLEKGTYDGFIAHDATVQVSKNGEIVQAWIKQRAEDVDYDAFLKAIGEIVEPYSYIPNRLKNSSRMLEISLFDMHWGIALFEHYESVLKDILDLIRDHTWDKIVIPFGQDFFHNDSIVNGITTRGTVIEKVDMQRAVKEGQKFMYAIIDAAIENANEVKVIYSAGNHDRSISWMFMQVLLERYGHSIVDDSLEYRKIVTYGKNAIMITHGNSKQATAKTLAHIFPISFPEEFANANIREIHAGHLHHESEADIHGIMVRRLSSGGLLDDWSNREDYVGTHKRFMLFEWDLNKLKTIHYI